MNLIVERLEIPLISDLMEWIQTNWLFLSFLEIFDEDFYAGYIKTMLFDYFQPVVEIVKKFDTGLANIEAKQTNFGVKLISHHDSESGLVEWPFEEESAGTQRMFRILFKVVHALESKTTALFDELTNSLHPQIGRYIVRMFQFPELNPGRAQLIFTSHDIALHNQSLLRRDQIWYTEKRSDGSTNLYPLSDFKPRKYLHLEDAYLDGRFGAVPFLPDEEEMRWLAEKNGKEDSETKC
jgi:AAA15 family ATPase/GTPase